MGPPTSGLFEIHFGNQYCGVSDAGFALQGLSNFYTLNSGLDVVETFVFSNLIKHSVMKGSNSSLRARGGFTQALRAPRHGGT